MSPRTAATPRAASRSSRGAAIPQTLLVAAGELGGLSAARVAGAIGRGLRAGGRPEPDLCPIATHCAEEVPEVLSTLGFDARMLRARAVIVADAHLQERTLAGSVTFEIATRARQRGVPAYAVTAANDLNAFDARILDLQLIVQANSVRALVAAGRELAAVA
ncbi:MAG TPA: glycerate kinase [Solirubrobacteraceae bacterium]